MREKIYYLLIVFFALFSLQASSSKLIGIEQGLSSRQVYSIAKSDKGFMWFLTHDGVDKYDGFTTTHYKLFNNGYEINASPDINFLKSNSHGEIIEIGRNGYIFEYNYNKDKFDLLLDFTDIAKQEKRINASSVYMDSYDRIWINISKKQFIFDIRTRSITQLNNQIKDEIIVMTEIGQDIFVLSSANYLYTILLKDNKIKILSKRYLSNLSMVNYLYYHKKSKSLIASTYSNGIIIYNVLTKTMKNVPYKFTNIFLNKIIPYKRSNDEVLIATNGGGIFKLNLKSLEMAQYEEGNNASIPVSTNIIKDIFIDEQEKIWMAVYPFGISVSSNMESLFKQLSHFESKANSLINNQVNYIYEDSDKDIWFLTNNGLSCYNPKKGKWTNILYKKEDDCDGKNHSFISIAEIKPGTFIISGYMSGIYLLTKKNLENKYYQLIKDKKHAPDKYIRSIYIDQRGDVWLGGYSYLKRYDITKDRLKIFSFSTPITYITAKSKDELWVGTYNGLYIFNSKREKLFKFNFSSRIEYITSVYQHNKDLTFIATNGNGLFVYNNITKKVKRYFERNSSLNSNYIYNIIPSNSSNILISTEKGISRFNINEDFFTNWTSEQGVPFTNFNASSGIRTSNGEYYFGSGNGAIMFTDASLIPVKTKTNLIFNSLYINYHKVSPLEKGSPLACNIDQAKVLNLEHDQNTFAIDLASINYENQSSIYYSWMLEGVYNKWSAPSHENKIEYTNLSPGKYRLMVRSISAENFSILDKKEIIIYVKAPFWGSLYAQIIYLLIISITVYYISKYVLIRKERNMSKEKIRFFINTAHDVRTPLSLIKAPLCEIERNEKLSEQGVKNLVLALKNTDQLTNLTNNLINFEKEELYSKNLTVTRCNLCEFINNILKELIPLAQRKNVRVAIKSMPDKDLMVLIDKNKVSSILRNVLSNAIKYTNPMGDINITADNDKKNWFIQITDTGIGIPNKDQKKLFRSLFRSENATNMQISGSGIGMLLTYKLVKSHQGRISVSSCENVGTSFRISFPLKSRKYVLSDKNIEKNELSLPAESNDKNKLSIPIGTEPEKAKSKYILIVEDNMELRNFMAKTLSVEYKVGEAANGLEALSSVKANFPDLIISDIMMPFMDGNELCKEIKENLETSHIPVILLTALNDKENIIKGLSTKADKYMTKPFDVQLLQATINNIFENRDIVRKAFAKGNFSYIQDNNIQSGIDIDKQFLFKVTESIKKNISKEINVDILCGYLNMSRSSFYNKIKALTDYSPSDYIRRVKMEEAARLLRSRNYTISEVADMVGFGDPKYFTDIFKKHFNMPPSTYMKQN